MPESDTPSILSSWTHGFADALDAAGHPGVDLLREAGIDPAALSAPLSRQPVEAIDRLWGLVHDRLGEQAGLAVAAQVRPGSWQALGLALMTSASGHDALARIVRYVHFLTELIDLQLLPGPPGCRRLEARLIRSVPYEHLRLEATLLSGLRVVNTVGFTVPLLGAELPRHRPGDPRPWEQAFGCKIRWHAPAAALLIDARTLDRPLPHVDPVLARAQMPLLEEYLKAQGEPDLAARARQAIARALPAGEPDMADIAGALNLSARSLQRRLAEQGSSFRALLDQVRERQAREWLGRGQTPAEVAYLLGYSDPANFSKAFQRWTGTTPGRFRTARASSESGGL